MIGREMECARLDEIYKSSKAEFVAIYGRRRVGKTFLIGEHFKGRITFSHAGLSPIEIQEAPGSTPLRKQLKHFYNSLILHGMKKSHCPENWLDAFLLLEQFLLGKQTDSRQIVFFDELPWMDTQKSGFMTAFEAFWNTWACHQNHLMVIVCGSATSWMMNELINNHGGLYNRLTCEIKLSPFTLKECEKYFEETEVRLSRYDIVQAYMITGGMPYYLSYFRKGKSLAQNVDHLFFLKNAPLKNEYDRLFSSVFANPEEMKSIIAVLSTRNAGYTRQEIIDKVKRTSGGTISKELQALTDSDFLLRYVPFGCGKREEHYKLIDPFCLFYLKFVLNRSTLDSSFWQDNLAAQQVISWRGIAFENVCFQHIQQIKNALGILGVYTKQSAWSKREDDQEGVQIDMIIERNDHVVNMCEMKFYSDEFAVEKAYDRVLRRRRALLEKEVSRTAVIHSTLITTYGIKYNEYSGDFDQVITIDSLFQ